MGRSTRITVVLCTYNRGRSLAEALKSVAASELSASIEWDVLVVDNNSNDQTRQVVEDFHHRFPGRFRYLFEPRQGKSHALNSAIQETQGDILAFLDDDETVSKEWLENLTANLHGGEWVGAGGRILPKWNCACPRWFSEKSAFTIAPLAVFDLGQKAGQLSEPPFGANMAFRREVFDKFGGFRTDLGRTGKGMISNEDTEFGRRLMAAGLRLRYEPSALTYHPVDQLRLSRSYFLKWWFNKGRSDVREAGNQPKRKHFLGIPLRLFKIFVRHGVEWSISVDPRQRFICKLKAWASAGQIYEFYYRWLDAKRKGPDRNSNFPPPVNGFG
jgi:glycosyltransferase involved in cell wall biosynthesis